MALFTLPLPRFYFSRLHPTLSLLCTSSHLSIPAHTYSSWFRHLPRLVHRQTPRLFKTLAVSHLLPTTYLVFFSPFSFYGLFGTCLPPHLTYHSFVGRRFVAYILYQPRSCSWVHTPPPSPRLPAGFLDSWVPFITLPCVFHADTTVYKQFFYLSRTLRHSWTTLLHHRHLPFGALICVVAATACLCCGLFATHTPPFWARAATAYRHLLGH